VLYVNHVVAPNPPAEGETEHDEQCGWRHPATADLPLDGVAVGEGRLEALEGIGHELGSQVELWLSYGWGRGVARVLVLQTICKPTGRDRTGETI
jgi:hypothetical protein